MWIRNNFFKYALGLLLILVNIYFFGKIEYLLVPVRGFIATLFLPLIISGILFYLLRPLIKLITKFKIPKTIAILIGFVLLLALLTIISASTGSMVVTQFKQLYSNLPHFFELANEKTTQFIGNDSLSFLPIGQIQEQISIILGKIVPFISQGLLAGVSTIANVAAALVIVPFVLFYLLKDEELLYKRLLGIIPEEHKGSGKEILEDVDKTLSTYIIGQAIIALTIGIMMYIGYLLLGLDYALILAIFAMLTAFIPILGALLGIIPALLVGLTVSPLLALKILALMIIVQQLEGNLLSPQVMGKRMNIHPLSFIVILLAAASLSGFVGMLIAVPSYAVIKVVFKGVYKIYALKKCECPKTES